MPAINWGLSRMSLKQRLAAGEPLLGTFFKTPSPMLCEVIAQTDIDFVCLDAEHSPFDRLTLDQCLFALRAGNMPGVVRVPALSGEPILNALDCGATGVVVPHVITADDAGFAARSAQFGQGRGFAGSTRAAGYMSKNMATHLSNSAAETVVIAQIEDKEALDNLDAIFATPGIDCFFIGRSDLTVSLGYDNPGHADVVATVEAICDKAKAADVRVGMFTANIEEIPSWREKGVSLFILSSDHSFMLQGAQAFSQKVRTLF